MLNDDVPLVGHHAFANFTREASAQYRTWVGAPLGAAWSGAKVTRSYRALRSMTSLPAQNRRGLTRPRQKLFGVESKSWSMLEAERHIEVLWTVSSSRKGGLMLGSTSAFAPDDRGVAVAAAVGSLPEKIVPKRARRR